MNKSDLRIKYLEKRRALSPKQLEDISEKICQLAFSNFQLEKKKISLFLPIYFECVTYNSFEIVKLHYSYRKMKSYYIQII